eukprot:7331359-Prymnesium_polylepis.1
MVPSCTSLGASTSPRWWLRMRAACEYANIRASATRTADPTAIGRQCWMAGKVRGTRLMFC